MFQAFTHFVFLCTVKKEEGLLLSEEDRKLLEKWKTMQTQPKTHARSGSDGSDTKPFTHARTASDGSIGRDPGNVPSPPTVIPTAQRLQQQQPGPNQQGTGFLVSDVKVKVKPVSTNSPTITQFTNVTPPLLQQTSSNSTIQGIVTNTGTNSKVEHVTFNVPNANNATSYPTTGINPSTLPFTSYVSQNPSFIPQGNAAHVTQGNPVHVTQGNPVHVTQGNLALVSQNPSLMPQGNPAHVRPPPGFAQLPPAVQQPNLTAAGTTLPSYDEALQAKMSSMVKPPMLPTLASRSGVQLGEAGIPEVKNLNFANVIGNVPDNRPRNTGIHRNTGSYSDEAQDSPPVPKAPASSPQVTTNIIGGAAEGIAPPPKTPSSQQQLPANWLNVLTQKMFRSHVEDLTLAQTPKGTGAGYGLGVDIDAILRETETSEAKDVEGYVVCYFNNCSIVQKVPV